MNPPTCSIVIPVHGQAEITRLCLEVLLDAPASRYASEIVVVDDASPDATAAMLQGFGDSIRVVSHAENRGFSRSCNDGAAASRGEFLVFLNNDTIPRTGWLDALVDHVRANPLAAMVGAKLLYPDGTIQHAGMAIDADLHPQHVYLGFPADHPAVNKTRKVPMVTGACVLIPRATFEGLKGFDEGFVNGYEDVDFCLRAVEGGGEIHYCPASEVVHLESISEGRRDRDEANRSRFQARWAHKIAPNDFLYYLQDGLIRFEYRGSTPMQFWVAPELGAVSIEDRRETADGLLLERSRHAFELLKENIALRVRLSQAALSA